MKLKNVFGDLFNVQHEIKVIDKDLDLYYRGNGNWEITHKGGHFMSVTREELNDKVVKQVREIVYRNVNKDILLEMELNNNKLDASKQRSIDNNIEAMGKEIRPLIQRL